MTHCQRCEKSGRGHVVPQVQECSICCTMATTTTQSLDQGCQPPRMSDASKCTHLARRFRRAPCVSELASKYTHVARRFRRAPSPRHRLAPGLWRLHTWLKTSRVNMPHSSQRALDRLPTFAIQACPCGVEAGACGTSDACLPPRYCIYGGLHSNSRHISHSCMRFFSRSLTLEPQPE